MTFKSTIERVTESALRVAAGGSVQRHRRLPAPTTKGKARRASRASPRAGATLTIRLSRSRTARFLANLAGGAACAVPRGTPAARAGSNDIPSAGPYYIASYTPRQQLVLRRNPNYHGDSPAAVSTRCVVAIGVTSRARSRADRGRRRPTTRSTVAPRGWAAAGVGVRSRQQGPRAAEAMRYFISEAHGARILHMNTSRPLFSDVRLRRAVNYAIDRPALAAQGRRVSRDQSVQRRLAHGRLHSAGRRRGDRLPSLPDERPRPAIEQSGSPGHTQATAIMYTPNISPWLEEAEIVRRNLKPIGIDVQVKEFPLGDFFTRVSRRSEPFDLAVSGYCDAPRSGAEHGVALRRRRNRLDATSRTSTILSSIASCTPSKGSRTQSVIRRPARLALELQRDFVPAAAFAVTASRDLFSARIGCQVYHPVWGMDLAALCLRN